MYQIRSESAKTLVEDRNIKLPRFQRKHVWDDKKKFKLCISIFKNYPIGMCVMNEEKVGIKATKWLLDGRQRRNALESLLDNPEEIYNWAKAFLKFKNNDQPDEIERKFWEAIEIHLEEDEVNEEQIHEIIENEEDAEEIEIDHSEYEIAYDKEINSGNNDDLLTLLHVIKICHNKTKSSSGFSKPFNFSKIIEPLDFVEYKSGYSKINAKKLVTYIRQFKQNMYSEGLDEVTRDSFQDYIITRHKVSKDKQPRLKKHIDQNWERIEQRIELVDILETKVRETLIGIIDIKSASSTDAQNIFKLINSEGTDLTAVEILSAKPSWNKRIDHPSDELILHVDTLYNEMKIKREGIVRWDFPATLMGRLTHLEMVFKKLSYTKETEFKTRVTLGFKILGAIYEKGITKEKISNVSKNKMITWKDDIEGLVRDFNLMGEILSDHSFYKFMKSWNTNLMDLTSDTISINFMVIMYKEWVRSDKPVGSNIRVKQFQTKSLILFDKMMYEYVTKQWRGSSDSRLVDNLEKFDSNIIFEPIKSEKWINLITEILEDNTLLDEMISVKTLKPILYYYYFLEELDGPYSSQITTIEIDHIIPQSLFESSPSEEKIMQHNLFNLCLLPKGENISKGKKNLVQIGDPWLIKMIEKYTMLKEDDFQEFIKPSSILMLKKRRQDIFLNAYDRKRKELLNII